MATFRNVRDVLENYASAIHEQNVDQFVSSYASDIHVYDCWGKWECIGISPFREGVNDWFTELREEGVTVKTEFDDVVVEESSALAFAHCVVTFAAYNNTGEKIRQTSNRFTFGLRKQNESWLIKHEHSSLPIDLETGQGIFNRR